MVIASTVTNAVSPMVKTTSVLVTRSQLPQKPAAMVFASNGVTQASAPTETTVGSPTATKPNSHNKAPQKRLVQRRPPRRLVTILASVSVTLESVSTVTTVDSDTEKKTREIVRFVIILF
jgi:hypothetical protein